MRESVVEDALDRIKTLESELAQTKRNMTHVEDCWGNIQSALGETEAELAAMTKRALNGEAAIATLMDVINTQKARLPYSQAAHLTTLEAELAEANATIKLVYDYDSNFIHAIRAVLESATPKLTDNGEDAT